MARLRSRPDCPSHSRLKTLNECEQRWWYEYVEEIEPVGAEDSAPLHAGSVMHKILANFYGWTQLANAPATDPAPLLEVWWQGKTFRGKKYEHITAGFLEVVFKNYLEYWHDRDTWFDIVAVEQQLEVQVPGIGQILITPDLVVRTSSGELAVVDHKCTTNYLGNKLLETVKRQHQLRMYALGMSEVLGEKITTGICNAIHLGKGQADPKSKAQLFDRYEFEWDEWELRETKRWVTQSSIKASITGSIAGRNPVQNCGHHCTWCPFEPLCYSNPVMREAIKKRDFQEKTYGS